MQRKTTQAIESPSKVVRGIYVYDFFFIFFFMIISFGLKTVINERFQIAFMMFSFLEALFLTSKSSINKKRRNFESIYFLLKKDIHTYRPYIGKRKEQ